MSTISIMLVQEETGNIATSIATTSEELQQPLSHHKSEDTCVQHRSSRLLRSICLCIALGAICGVLLAAFTLNHSVTGASIAAAAMSYATVGAAAGLLVAGFWDVIVGGSLEDLPE